MSRFPTDMNTQQTHTELSSFSYGVNCASPIMMPGSEEKDVNEFMDFFEVYERVYSKQELRMFAAAVWSRNSLDNFNLKSPPRPRTMSKPSHTELGKRKRNHEDSAGECSPEPPATGSETSALKRKKITQDRAHLSATSASAASNSSPANEPSALHPHVSEYLSTVHTALQQSSENHFPFSEFSECLANWWRGSLDYIDLVRKFSEPLSFSFNLLEGLVKVLALKDGTTIDRYSSSNGASFVVVSRFYRGLIIASSFGAVTCPITCTDELRQVIAGGGQDLTNLPSLWVPGVMQLLQLELDNPVSNPVYRKMCMKQLRKLSTKFHELPPSLSLKDILLVDSRAITGGGFADIWRGTINGQNVCLKVLRVFLRSDDAMRSKVISDFCREALVWRQLKHPNVLPFLGVNTELFTPGFCLVSPWMSNGDLMSYLTLHPEYNRIAAVSQLAEGMNYLHSLQPPIIHGDIKGANILVSDDHQCCLADFGLAVAAESQSLGTTTTGIRGSVRWLAPELFGLDPVPDRENLTPRDVYAFGCTAYEIISGQVPFAGLSPDAKVMMAILNGVRPARPENAWCQDYIWNLVERCWTQDPLLRPQSKDICKVLKNGSK